MVIKKPTPLDLLRELKRSNCGECGVPTCMAFAAQVIQGQKKPELCPYLDPAVAHRFSQALHPDHAPQDNGLEMVQVLQSEMPGLDLPAIAKRLGGKMIGEQLRLHVLGKIFEIDAKGGLHTLCHSNTWIHAPLLDYIIHGQGTMPTGQWGHFSELSGTTALIPFFKHRAETPLAQLAEKHPDLFLDILDIFGKQIPVRDFSTDKTYVLHPLPEVPVLFAFWQKDEEFDARLSILFDKTATKNLSPESLFRLGSGMALMFKAIAERHGGVI